MGSVLGLRSVHHAHEPRVLAADGTSAVRGGFMGSALGLASMHGALEPGRAKGSSEFKVQSDGS
jgi:hypothetical protein